MTDEYTIYVNDFDVNVNVTTEDDSFETAHPVWAATIVICTGLSGFIVNAYILYRILFHKVFGRLFGWMWIAREVSLLCPDFIKCGVYGPSLLFSPLSIRTSLIIYQPSLIAGIQIATTTLLIASNRCLLIRKPFKFKHVFTPQRTKILIFIAWVIPIFIVLGLYFFPDCPMAEYGASGESVTICVTLEVLTTALFMCAFLIITLIIDLVSICTLYRMNNMRAGMLSAHLSPEKRRKQLHLCYMIILQSLLAASTALLKILFDVLLFDVADTLDGLIMIYFKDSLRPCWKKEQTTKINNVITISCNVK